MLLAQTSGQTAGAGAGGSIVFVVVGIFILAAMWRVYTKAGQPGWAVIVPFYNIYIMLRIAGRPGWWLILYFIPFVNLIIAILVSVDIATAFGKSGWFAAGLIILPFIFYPILGFGPATYLGPPQPAPR
jgi:hypothetical protein